MTPSPTERLPKFENDGVGAAMPKYGNVHALQPSVPILRTVASTAIVRKGLLTQARPSPSPRVPLYS